MVAQQEAKSQSRRFSAALNNNKRVSKSHRTREHLLPPLKATPRTYCGESGSIGLFDARGAACLASRARYAPPVPPTRLTPTCGVSESIGCHYLYERHAVPYLRQADVSKKVENLLVDDEAPALSNRTEHLRRQLTMYPISLTPTSVTTNTQLPHWKRCTCNYYCRTIFR